MARTCDDSPCAAALALQPGVLRDAEPSSEALAAAAGLRYVDTDEPGYTRRRCGCGFTFRDPRGRTVPRGRVRKRLQSLPIPPAWRHVWICRDEDGHIQATGRDEAGRKQYIYHPRWTEERGRIKFERLVIFGRRLPQIRATVDADLDREGLSRPRVLAAVVRLLETSHARIGNDSYAEANRSYGLCTLRKRHVERDDAVVRLRFRGKSGRPWEIEVKDAPVIAVIDECLQAPGWRLFQYYDDEGCRREVVAPEVNDYVHEVGHPRLSAKDFRTWAGTVTVAEALWDGPEAAGSRSTSQVARAIRTAAQRLGNTPAVCRSAYVHPKVIQGFLNGEQPPAPRRRSSRRHGLRPQERRVLAYLEGR